MATLRQSSAYEEVGDEPSSRKRLEAFYSAGPGLEARSTGTETLYEIWERGAAAGDSVTPSTYCQGYRDHLVACIDSIAGPNGSVFSLGCGNAFVEADLVKLGHDVVGVDCHAEAVDLAIRKGVRAVQADFYDMPTGTLAGVDVVYADGFLGHLYDPSTGLDRFFRQLVQMGMPDGCALVVSNDAPLKPGPDVEPHATAPNFWMLSKDYIAKELVRAGRRIDQSYYWQYERPISGIRNRSICISLSSS